MFASLTCEVSRFSGNDRVDCRPSGDIVLTEMVKIAVFSLKSLSLTLPGAVTIQPLNGGVFRKIANRHTNCERPKTVRTSCLESGDIQFLFRKNRDFLILDLNFTKTQIIL